MKSATSARHSIFDLQPLEVRRFLTSAFLSGTTLNIDGTSSGETITVNRLSTGRVSVTGVTATFLNSAFTHIDIDAGGGNDTILISNNVVYLTSDIEGANGQDTMTGGRGADHIHGDAGLDTANYSARTAALRVSLNDSTADGENNGAEGDDIDCEEVIGGSGNDRLIGTVGTVQDFLAGGGGNDSINGNGGNDEILGNTGSDTLHGDEGDDALYAKNNDVDTVNGGTGPGSPDLDLASLDGVDITPALTTLTLAKQRAAALAAVGYAPLELNTEYGGPDNDGKNLGPDFGWDAITAATVDAQGRTILVGYDFRPGLDGPGGYDFVAMRYNADGTFDETFGTGYGQEPTGEAVINFDEDPFDSFADDDYAYGVTTDAQGSIYIVGASRDRVAEGPSDDFAICKLSSSGVLEDGFGTRRYDVDPSDPEVGGGMNDAAHDVVVDSSGRIVIAGTHITYFDPPPVGEGDFVPASQANGNSDYAVMRLLNDGSLDDNFNGGGMNTLDIGVDDGIAVDMQDTSGRIVVGGTSSDAMVVAAFKDDGTLDDTFGPLGGYNSVQSLGSVSELNDLAVNDLDGQIVAVGQTYGFGQVSIFVRSPVPNDDSLGVVLLMSPSGGLSDAKTSDEDLPETPMSFNAVAWDSATDQFAVAGATDLEFVLTKLESKAAIEGPNFIDWPEGLEGEYAFTGFRVPETENERLDVALGLGFVDASFGEEFTKKRIVVGGYSSYEDLQSAVARYGEFFEIPDEDPVDVVSEVEDDVSYEQIQGGFHDDRRSPGASAFLKGTTLDEDGNAVIDLTNGNDVVRVYNIVDDNLVPMGLLGVDVNGIVYPFDPAETNSITINGKRGHDRIEADADVTFPLIINGDAGNDRLGGGGGDDIVNGGADFDVVWGGGGNDVVLGGTGIASFWGLLDLVYGDAGNDIVIGGAGFDSVSGGTGEDILIGGTTAYDNDYAALAALSAEWGSSNDRDTRITNLRSGAGLTNGNALQVGVTMFNDNAKDLLSGGNDLDWFFSRNTGSTLVRDTILDGNPATEEFDIL